MTIKKFQGTTKEEAIKAAKDEFGDQVVIMNIREIRPSGLFGIFRKSTYEVTAAIEDGVKKTKSFESVARDNEMMAAKRESKTEGGHISIAADEEIKVPPVQEGNIAQDITQDIPRDSALMQNARSNVNENELQSAFKAVNEVIQSGTIPSVTEAQTYNKNAKIIQSASQGNYMTRETTSQVNQQMTPQVNQQMTPQVNQQMSPQVEAQNRNDRVPKGQTNMAFVKMLYNVLLSNEVDEKYINQLIEDMDKVLSSGNSLDYVLSNVYQKLVLNMGKPSVIQFRGKKPMVVFLIGPTGVGKTTTIAKIASKYKLEYNKKVAMVTSDTYRIAATDQLRTYANILDTPLSVVYSPDEINDAIDKLKDHDLILVDTAGFSHKNQEQKEDMKKLLMNLNPAYERAVYLVLSSTTKYKDLKEIIDTYTAFTKFRLIFTKLDETTAYGNILNCKLYSGADLSYVTTGQNVPDDMEVVDTQHIVKQLLGGH
ncbi:MAG: flagellar biosynthesis protein FlhF [Lachnospiraceae bacterium]|nr:flagellar biosynthesis protein FlhF [Lachnospiraceae bacterium]